MAESNDNTTCVVCFKNVTFYSIGECDHPVCFECSTRMRVLCLQNECPICRQDLSRVVFTEQVLPYKELRNTVFTDRQFERQFKIGFCTEEIKNAYDILLENRCKLCQKIAPFRTFTMLSDHMRKVHERFFCDLCVKHLKIFTCERKCYTRQELAHHRRKGDLDDTSHRGHPLCEFCEERFMDADELYRHLRKEHLYCHLCDADGRNLYYATHAALAHHFRSDHYLCEEGDCAGQHLTAVFRSEIDLKAHKATVHGRGLNRGAARQARTLELQFNITPHSVVTRTTPRDRERAVSPPPTPPPAADIDTRSDQHFPRLSAAAPQQNIMLGAVARAYKGAGGLARTDKNFPTLGGGGAGTNPTPAQGPQPAAAIMRNSKPSVSIQLRSQPASASNFRLTQPTGNRISVPPQKKPSPLTDDDFPSLSMGKDDYPSIGAGTMQPPKVTMINSQEMQALKSKPSQSQPKKSQLSSEAFPALSSSSAPATTPQWITVSKPKEKAKPKAEPPPKPKTFNQVADFPGLPANTTNNNKSKAKKIPAPQPTPSIQSENKSKKEKKKQNNNAKKENFSEPNLVNGIEDIKNYDMAYVLATVNNNQNAEVDKKIKTLENTSTSDKKKGNGDFSLKTMEYPPLNSRNENLPEKKVTSYPEKKKQPERKMNGSVPPGFGSRATCNGMTFTNSSGQTFSAPLHSYIAPPNFEARNRALVKKFTDALGSAAAVDDFKVASRAFRDNIISAEEFYQHCKTAMGSKLDSVFSELVALLPDIGKQQEMVVGRSSTLELEACDTCGQLFASADKVSHETAHWPPLAPR